MRLARILVAAATLAAIAPALAAARTADPRDPFVGSWKGRGSQSDEPGSWSIATTIVAGRPGDVVGTITYPSLACGGDLVFHGVEAGQMVLQEHITFGSCVDRGIITLGVRRDGGLTFDWRAEEGGPTATGYLRSANAPE